MRLFTRFAGSKHIVLEGEAAGAPNVTPVRLLVFDDPMLAGRYEWLVDERDDVHAAMRALARPAYPRHRRPPPPARPAPPGLPAHPPPPTRGVAGRPTAGARQRRRAPVRAARGRLGNR